MLSSFQFLTKAALLPAAILFFSAVQPVVAEEELNGVTSQELPEGASHRHCGARRHCNCPPGPQGPQGPQGVPGVPGPLAIPYLYAVQSTVGTTTVLQGNSIPFNTPPVSSLDPTITQLDATTFFLSELGTYEVDVRVYPAADATFAPVRLQLELNGVAVPFPVPLFSDSPTSLHAVVQVVGVGQTLEVVVLDDDLVLQSGLGASIVIEKLVDPVVL